MALNDIKVPKENAQGTFDEVVLTPNQIGAAASTHAASHASAGSDPLAPSDLGLGATDSVTFGDVATDVVTCAAFADASENTQLQFDDGIHRLINNSTETITVSDTDASFQVPIAFGGANAATNAETTRDNLGLGATDDVTFNSVTAESLKDTSGAVIINTDSRVIYDGSGTNASDIVLGFGDGVLETALPISFSNDNNQASENAATTRTNLGLGDAATADIGTGSTEVAAGDHGHGNLSSDGKIGSTAGLPVVTTTAGAVTTLALGTAGQVLTVNSGATGVEFAAASGGGVTAVGASTADVLSVSGSDLVADDGGTIDSSDPFIKWDDAAGKLVYANPLSRPSGAFYVGLAPTTTALGSGSVNIQPSRTNANQVAAGASSVAIGQNARSSGTEGIAIGLTSAATGSLQPIAIGPSATASGNYDVAIGHRTTASGANSIAIGGNNSFVSTTASGLWSIAIGAQNSSTASASTALGFGVGASLRAQLATLPFAAVYWGGQTTNNSATVLNLDATATNRFTIAASTALAVDILLVARRSDTQDKWLVARRFLGIRRDGSNNTSLIGSVQTLGTDQSDGSPSWTFALTADDTNEALQLEVTGAASETVQWRATAFYRVV